MQKLQPLLLMTPLAKQKLSQVLEEQKASSAFLRIEVLQGAGCACSGGYRYAMSLEEKPRTTDLVEEVEGFKVAVDQSNADLLRGSKIDYRESLQRSGFKIENPNVHAEACGCGGH
jgi:iron-sulfur cluster assembly protein